MAGYLGDVAKGNEGELIRLTNLHGYHIECADSMDTNTKVDTIRKAFYAKHKIAIDYELLKATQYDNLYRGSASQRHRPTQPGSGRQYLPTDRI
ncbi:hypothetical protein N7530_002178 [Penicillium desertorum]|uniref:Uncharacterized protein n=1 Tax=Penicillium desertorum TaxID=1303715 RepID=A0A9W9XBB4_9EURO|nr:hypothetical protein N7530_002178 [Penicillium desertorum]